MALTVINIDTPTLGDRSYIAHDGKTALAVDPQRDIDRVQAILDREGLTLGGVVETHMHNDYVSGGLVLAQEHGAKYIVSEMDPVSFKRTTVVDNQVVPVGSFAIKAVHTPGHTYTHMSYALLDGNEQAQGIFTGGSMLHGSTGRPDLLGWDHARELAGLQHGSLNRLAGLLEDGVNVHPTHGFGSFCAATATCGDSSTIADEKKTNPALLLEKEAYIVQTLAGLDVFPAYYKHMGPANHAGPGPIDLSDLARMTTDEIMAAMNTGAWIVDLRTRTSWAAGHVPGTMSFGLDGSMATYLGWMFPYDKQLVLMSDKAIDISNAQRELVRIGIDRPAGSYVGEVSKFGELGTTRTVSFKDLSAVIGGQDVHVLDVRRTSEREASHIEPSLHIPLHELEGRVNELPTDGEIWVHCAGAYRAAAALGIIENSKRTAVLINEPYDACLRVDGLNIVTGHMDAGPVSPSDVVANV
ncbi:MAG: MBL fold metallo-hydrolase [Candidatus Nanopelagicales bacterium]|nr:MBL fold metallo-hydrolase [Candidatus Nanopelagicales bacterium]